MLDVGIRYLTFEELNEVPTPSVVFASLEATLSIDQEWQKQVASLNELRSLLKFNLPMLEESPQTASIFKKVGLLVVSMKSAVSKLSMLAIQEGIPKLGLIFAKLSGFFLQQLFSKLADCNSFLLVEVEKALEVLFSNCCGGKLLLCLTSFSEHKNPAVKIQVIKGFSKSLTKLQTEIFIQKEYERYLKMLSSYTRDANSDVRTASKACVKQLADLSDQPELILKAIQHNPTKLVIHQKNDTSAREETASRRMDRKVGLQLKRLASNKITNLNRTEELVKELHPVSIVTRNGKPIMQQSAIRPEEDLEESMAKKALPLMQRRKKTPQLTRNYPELEVLGELIQDLQKEG
jgi:hypothetical protein